MNRQQLTCQYMPLDKDERQIRLLHLHPPVDEFDDKADVHGHDASIDICCTFSIASLNKRPQYEALSYVWGDAKDVSSIILNGQRFSVTSNLRSTLLQVRQTKQTRTLWVDALCINQDDIDERSNQVSLMHQIYSQGSSVLISLGEAWEGSEAAIDFIELIGSNTALHFDTSLEPSTKYYNMDFKSENLQRYLLRFFICPGGLVSGLYRSGASHTMLSSCAVEGSLMDFSFRALHGTALRMMLAVRLINGLAPA